MSVDRAQPSESIRRKERLIEWVFLGAIITMAYLAIPSWLSRLTWRFFPDKMRIKEWWAWYRELLTLGFAVLLICGSWKRSGLRIGSIGRHWRGVSVVCVIPVVLTAIVYPLLPERPFSGMTFHMWLTSPWHQDLVFAGYLYGRFEKVVPSYVHERIRIRWALVLAAFFFSAMHLPWFLHASPAYVGFMLAYTFLGTVLIGLACQWTGSILYGAITHMGVNLIAWAAS